MEDNRRCTNCGRFPFCLYQSICIYYPYDNTKEKDYWIYRDIDKEEE